MGRDEHLTKKEIRAARRAERRLRADSASDDEKARSKVRRFRNATMRLVGFDFGLKPGSFTQMTAMQSDGALHVVDVEIVEER